jgi:uncharacterized membrane protein YGL010W
VGTKFLDMETTATNQVSARGGLLAWQLASYGTTHRDRRNLLLHIATVPAFWMGNIALVAAPFVSWALAPLGVLVMLAVLALQGRGHAREGARPAPFRDKADIIARLFAEQWITFPRFIISGGWRRALHGG